jgi:two-component system, response regulator, stage 0 sporulation protein F
LSGERLRPGRRSGQRLERPFRRTAMKKILVADDEMAIRLLYSEELKEEGYEVYTAANGREALEIVEKMPLDLVILDIKMPEMDGIEALRQIKERKPDLPVLLSTAYGEYKQDFATWASDDYLVKSSDLEDLKSAVKRYLKD